MSLAVHWRDLLHLPADTAHTLHRCDCRTLVDAAVADARAARSLLAYLIGQLAGHRAEAAAWRRRHDALLHLAHTLADAEAAQRARAEHAEARLHAHRIPLYDLLPQQRVTEERTAS